MGGGGDARDVHSRFRNPASHAMTQQVALICGMNMPLSAQHSPPPMCMYVRTRSTYLWRQGLLSDEMYRGDLMFGALLKQYAPWVHGGYLTYGR
jgi:hypothetical protein